MKIFFNYLGQLRLYTLADLILLLVAIGASTHQFYGAILLHVGFLAYLESRHAHSYRAKVPANAAYALTFIGIVLFRKIEGLLYVLFSYLYPKKNKNLGWMSPFARGFQYFFMVAGIIGYASGITYLVGVLTFFRNLAGDMRDTEKDRFEGMNTIPVLLNIKKSIPHIHLIAVIITSSVWWHLSSLSIAWLVVVMLIQLLTYKLTPR